MPSSKPVTVTLLLWLTSRGLVLKSQLSRPWRRQRDEIAKVGMTSRKRGSEVRRQRIHGSRMSSSFARTLWFLRTSAWLFGCETMLEIPKKKPPNYSGIPLNDTRERRERLIVASRGAGGADWANGARAFSRLWVWLVPRCIAGVQPVTPQTEASCLGRTELSIETEREEVLGALHCDAVRRQGARSACGRTLLDLREPTFFCFDSQRDLDRILDVEHGEVTRAPEP